MSFSVLPSAIIKAVSSVSGQLIVANNTQLMSYSLSNTFQYALNLDAKCSYSPDNYVNGVAVYGTTVYTIYYNGAVCQNDVASGLSKGVLQLKSNFTDLSQINGVAFDSTNLFVAGSALAYKMPFTQLGTPGPIRYVTNCFRNKVHLCVEPLLRLQPPRQVYSLKLTIICMCSNHVDKHFKFQHRHCFDVNHDKHFYEYK